MLLKAIFLTKKLKMAAAENLDIEQRSSELRVSYFQIQDEKARALKKTSILHRLFFISHILNIMETLSRKNL